jgi:putative two-component system response regulator
MLPDIDGFEVCKQLKNEADTRLVPVIMLTALVDEASKQRGRECGASEYLTKPFDPDRLMAALSKHAGNSR